jgi:dynein heavy chain
VEHYAHHFQSRAFFKYATGAAKAYPEIDEVATQVAGLQQECKQLAELAAVFEFPQLVEPAAKGVKELWDTLVAVKDVWDTTELCSLQFQVRLCASSILQMIIHLRAHTSRARGVAPA